MLALLVLAVLPGTATASVHVNIVPWLCFGWHWTPCACPSTCSKSYNTTGLYLRPHELCAVCKHLNASAAPLTPLGDSCLDVLGTSSHSGPSGAEFRSAGPV